ncbi:ESX secretion-associated protein EspG [Nocardia puris]|uniref:ESX secretion-associated protein EspG n=1 Tax=Nocardia puris TaxID=208602 RepID=UPI0018962DBA|nr:ESX secretion-associated protein EspG [Nocardia puris]MBF6211555.1 ESX secretion-associated protein EspG [Nocardia puris]MBF6366807.1 ESX secretion-associated protein EspG [Nocardia puris]MBF6461148.1 ESX secretion-associated protein EspG [Nocardia puris]
MNRRWDFTDLEFVALWDGMREGSLPQPFSFISRTEFRQDFLRECARTRERLRDSEGHELARIFEDIARPDIAVRIRGLRGPDAAEPANVVRLLAVRRGERGYVVSQSPGETVEHSGGFTVTEVGALSLADAVVSRLPEVGPGTHKHIVLPTPEEFADGRRDMDDSHESSPLWDSFEPSDAHRAESFLRSATRGMGTMTVDQGRSKFGPRGRVRRRLEWRDVVEDGRYVIVSGSPPFAAAADERRMIAAINTEIAAVVKSIKDEVY